MFNVPVRSPALTGKTSDPPLHPPYAEGVLRPQRKTSPQINSPSNEFEGATLSVRFVGNKKASSSWERIRRIGVRTLRQHSKKIHYPLPHQHHLPGFRKTSTGKPVKIDSAGDFFSCIIFPVPGSLVCSWF